MVRLKEGEVRIPSGCAIAGIMNQRGNSFSGDRIISCIAGMHQRSNGLGGGFAAYGIYPQYERAYALHLYYDHEKARSDSENLLNHNLKIYYAEPIPVRKHSRVGEAPLAWRYFADPREARLNETGVGEEEFMVRTLMKINSGIAGAFVVSSGHNMGVFKGVAYPEDLGDYYRLDEYRAYLWTAHGRFPTNTPGWWGGAHPFTLLDWSVVHNGEISSYGSNRRFLEMLGYCCSLQTDTEVIAYIFDFLMRKERLSLSETVNVIAAPLWEDIDEPKLAWLRHRYSSLLLNGPFSIIIATGNGMVAVNDRIKLRPLVAARKDDFLYISSEEAAIRRVEPNLDKLWSPSGGEPVVGLLENKAGLIEPNLTGVFIRSA